MQIGSSYRLMDGLSLKKLQEFANIDNLSDDVQLKFEKGAETPTLYFRSVKSSPKENMQIRDAVLKAFLAEDNADPDLHATAMNHRADFSKFLTSKKNGRENLTFGEIRGLLKTLVAFKELDAQPSSDSSKDNVKSSQKPIGKRNVSVPKGQRPKTTSVAGNSTSQKTNNTSKIPLKTKAGKTTGSSGQTSLKDRKISVAGRQSPITKNVFNTRRKAALEKMNSDFFAGMVGRNTPRKTSTNQNSRGDEAQTGLTNQKAVVVQGKRKPKQKRFGG